MCHVDQISVEQIFPFFMYFSNHISVFCLLSQDIIASLNFNERAEFFSLCSSMIYLHVYKFL